MLRRHHPEVWQNSQPCNQMLESKKLWPVLWKQKQGEIKKSKLHAAVIYPHNFILSHCSALQCLSFKFWPNEKIEFFEKMNNWKWRKVKVKAAPHSFLILQYSTQILLEGCTHRNYSGCHSQLLLFTHDIVVLDSSGNYFWVAIVMITEVY